MSTQTNQEVRDRIAHAEANADSLQHVKLQTPHKSADSAQDCNKAFRCGKCGAEMNAAEAAEHPVDCTRLTASGYAGEAENGPKV